MSRYQLGQPEPALAILRDLVDRKDPTWLAGWSSLFAGRCLIATGKVPEALAFFERAVAENPYQAQFIAGLVDAVLASGSVERKQQVVAKYEAQFANDPDMLNTLAWTLATTANPKMRDADEAVRLAKRSTEIKQTDDSAWNTLGVALYYAGDLQGALTALRRSVRIQGAGNVVDWLFLSMTLQRTGSTGEARVWYERAMDWMTAQSGVDPETARFRAEADALFAK
jgi:tetratricopeptide (TPR) repeat protein